jgi:hypothetical protein
VPISTATEVALGTVPPSASTVVAVSSATVGMAAVPVVVIGYGAGARGHEYLMIAIVLFGFTVLAVLAVAGLLVGRTS